MKIGFSIKAKPRTDLEVRAKANTFLIAIARNILDNDIPCAITSENGISKEATLLALSEVSTMLEMAQIVLRSEEAMAELATIQTNLANQGKAWMEAEMIKAFCEKYRK